MKYIYSCLLSIMLGCSQSKVQENTSSDFSLKSKAVIEDFFENVKSGNYNASLKGLLSKNKNIDLLDSLTISLENKFAAINESSGKFMSKRLLRQKELESDLGVYVYLVKYEKKFYRFTFTFYNNDVEVKLYKFSFDDTIDVEIEEGIKLYVN